MNPVIIIQARMNSKRLLHKVFRKIDGIRLIDKVIYECKKTKLPVILAVPLKELGEFQGRGVSASIYGGSEYDVLTRFYSVAKAIDADPIIRVCSDAKHIHHELILQQLENYRKYKHTCYGNFCEVFSFDELEHAYYYDKRPSSREHVSLGMIQDLTVDYEVDLM